MKTKVTIKPVGVEVKEGKQIYNFISYKELIKFEKYSSPPTLLSIPATANSRIV